MSRLDQILKLLQASPNDLELHYMVAMEYRAQGEYDKAVAKFDECIERDDTYTAAFFQKANTLIASGDTDRARDVLNAGIERARASGDDHAAEEMLALLDTM